MRILGIVSDSKTIRLSLVEGNKREPSRVPLEVERLAMPSDKKLPVGPFLSKCKASFEVLIQGLSVDKIVIEKAVGSAYSLPLATRTKFEGILEVLGHDNGILVELKTMKQTTTARGHFETYTGGTEEEILNGGVDFRPKKLKDATILAWCGFE